MVFKLVPFTRETIMKSYPCLSSRSSTHSWPTLLAPVLVACALLAGCANGPQTTSTPYSTSQYPASENHYGTVQSIEYGSESSSNNGGGAVVGGLVGALLGNQIGSGSGRTAATVAGAVGGAVVGNNVQENRNSQNNGQVRINVRMANGEIMSFTQSNPSQLRAGQAVRIVNGHVYRKEN
jgi:outer membrane lipoprotein SlyB